MQVQIAIHSNLSMSVQNLSFNGLYCYLVILTEKKTFQVKILSLKFVKFYILKNFKPQSIAGIE